MDNLSHILTGLAAGEFIHRSLCKESCVQEDRIRRRLLLIAAGLASNFPDLDVVLTPLLPEPLGYLLHHRGHTHTLLYVIPQALFLWAMIWLNWPAARNLLKKSTTARLGLGLAISVGLVLHLLMDYLNSYGVHPFHPFDSRWLYGDMVFIVEPLFWVLFGVPMIMTLQRNSIRLLLMTTLAAVLVFLTLQEYLPWISLIVLIILAGMLTLVQHKSGSRGTSAITVSLLVGIGFVSVQHTASNLAKEAVLQRVEQEGLQSRFVDASMTSFPTNPLCWMFVSVESNEQQDIYSLRRGMLSLAPDLMPVSECPARFIEDQAKRVTRTAIIFYSRHDASLEQLRSLAHQNCHFNAWMRFARAPLLENNRASDIRFSASLRGNFTTMRLNDFDNRACPRYVPPWEFPRLDLLTPQNR